MAFMAKHKEVSVETSEAMEQRFRPIAPKPMPPPPMPIGATVSNIQWRAQKRGRQDYLVPPPMIKRERDMISYPPPPAWWATGDVERPMEARGWCMPKIFLPSCEEDLRRLSLNKGSFASPWAPLPDVERLFPIERDLISKLQVTKVIKPRPTRPKCTTIYIDCSNIVESTNNMPVEVAMSKKTPREVVAELELPNALPAIVSGCNNNRVHLTNDAYKKMVGQPLCPWLGSLSGATASRRINGEVVLYVQTFSIISCLPSTRCAFPCTAKISWKHEDGTALLTVPCVVEHLTGNSNDYCFIWRFDSKRASIMYNLT
ncbi:unnamed protein product [Urochloa decumbens]|uniref:DUF7950 domain-containing protein n=1 Tax=Urochloa decumbens TaxID=240449 RepID=A0ABC8YBM2_9POAL